MLDIRDDHHDFECDQFKRESGVAAEGSSDPSCTMSTVSLIVGSKVTAN